MTFDSLGGLFGFGIGFFVLGLAYYIYASVTLMTIAKRTNTENAWLAWIPIGNLYLMSQIGGLHAWTVALFLLTIIPVVGMIVAAGIWAWYWMAICEKCGKNKFLGILILVPIANLILMGILAWGKD